MSRVYVLDPMLATGGSAVRALHHLKAREPGSSSSSASSPRPRAWRRSRPSMRTSAIWTAAIDRELDENAYIRPGLGDAGDRVFGTL